ncbi:MAG: 2-oxoglutarate dehydrogenase complex dihydrolipoyllysine-residue succinyltransferase [Planctomycetota bacterium]
MAVDIVIPSAGESVTSGVVLRWVKKIGDFVKRDETVLEVETDKATMEVPAPAAGVLTSQGVKEGDTIPIGAKVGSIDDKAAAPVSTQAAAPAAAQAVAPAATVEAKTPALVGAGAAARDDVRATPLARKTAEMMQVDLGKVPATGPGGRVREADVVGAAKGGVGAATSSNGNAKGHGPDARATREKMTPIRSRIAQRLVQAQHTAAMLTTFNEVDMGPVMDLRKQYKEEFEKKHAIGLGFMSFFVKACTSALRAFPMVNACIVEEAGQLMIEKHATQDIAVAVSTPKGLIVPVIRDCNALSMAGIESKIKDLAARGKDGKVSLEEMQGGTFTITNGGVFGSLMSTPILNPPQSAILGMHSIKSRAVEFPVGSGQVGIRPMMYLALSYDHRIIDGSEAVQFLVKIKQAIEDPQRMLLEI